jgi:ankyrin repeat protein
MSIHKAIEKGDRKKVKELLASGARVEERNRDGQTPLMVTVMYNLRPLFEMLLEAGADVDAADRTGDTVMHYAATYGTPTLVQALLEKKPDLDARNSEGEPPLMVALNSRVVELLLQAGAGPNARRNDSLTLLDLCEILREHQGRSKESKIAQLLRAAGAGKEPSSRRSNQ